MPLRHHQAGPQLVDGLDDHVGAVEDLADVALVHAFPLANGHVRVDGPDPFLGRINLAAAEGAGDRKELAIQVGGLERVLVDDAEVAYAGPDKDLQCDAAKAPEPGEVQVAVLSRSCSASLTIPMLRSTMAA